MCTGKNQHFLKNIFTPLQSIVATPFEKKNIYIDLLAIDANSAASLNCIFFSNFSPLFYVPESLWLFYSVMGNPWSIKNVHLMLLNS